MSDKRLTLTLERGEKGLGFNIKGGTDAPYVSGDTGIFISKVKDEGAAAKDGRLKVGDKIVEVNGKCLENVVHNVAVESFLTAGDSVTLTVIQNTGHFERTRKPAKQNGLPYRFIIPVTVGIALVGMMYFLKARIST